MTAEDTTIANMPENWEDRADLAAAFRWSARLDWHEVTKIAHYYLSVDAMSQPMEIRERGSEYGEGS